MNSVLTDLGLTANEAQVYLAYVQNGSKTAAEMARIINMDKSSCYRAVESLLEKGLLVQIPRKRGTTYSLVSPLILKDLLHKRKKDLEATEHSLSHFIDSLRKQTDETRTTFIRVEKGIEAIRNSMDYSLNAAIQGNKMIKERYRLDFPYFKDPYHISWVNRFAKRRIESGVSIHQIVEFAGESIFAPIMKTDTKLLKEVRLMPKEMKDAHGFRIAGDTVCIISFDKKKDYIVIIIRDQYVTELMESMFDFLWNRCEIKK